ncbi:RagB/SusD family nutrient uptake outer membrane protein [Pedobacter sp. ASV28]|uniref:RagB/SusD family nutrient uptake outer membrane protein n=1 Tax=Pedobacter sp. ASV28 TaxID=2795123 RepID=UPI0018EB8453|nr:RagB/SusD family nutrient uptake outer membrane protein [Pedobacter sp. ASV28]
MKRTVLTIFVIICLVSCKKQDRWLDVKSNKADIVPTTLTDFQALLDNDLIMNDNYPGLGILGSDNLFLALNAWQSGNATERNSYLWASDIFEGASSADWSSQYQKVAYANIVLEGLEKVQDKTSIAYKTIRASALFYRAFAFYSLAALFSPPYNSANLAKPGIVLRLGSDVNKTVPRSTVKETYDKIISDLNAALPDLPNLQTITTKPSKAVVYGLLGRIYLAMGDYPNAYINSNEALKLYSVLINFNTLNAAATYPFPTFQNKNAEVIFYATAVGYASFIASRIQVTPDIFNEYQIADLRRSLFYNANVNGTFFRGYYSGRNGYIFSGIATNELFLIRAEAAARTNRVQEAMTDLNNLLKTRWSSSSTYLDLSATNETEALQHILRERRKEMPFTASLRWEDLRRLNTDQRFATVLTRQLNNQTYTLEANSVKYVYPIPNIEIRINGVEQNER